MHVGNVIKLFHDGQYGKVKSRSGEEAHFHKGCLWDIQFAELTEGQGVEFEIQSSYKGNLAFHIRPYPENNFL